LADEVFTDVGGGFAVEAVEGSIEFRVFGEEFLGLGGIGEEDDLVGAGVFSDNAEKLTGVLGVGIASDDDLGGFGAGTVEGDEQQWCGGGGLGEGDGSGAE